METIINKKLSYGKQLIDVDDINRVSDALMSDFITIGPAVEEFETSIANYVGATDSIAVSSGTAALHCAYAALSIKGREVITSPLTFVATASMAIFEGATIVFADVDKDTGNIDPNHVKHHLTDKTSVITIVDYAGNPCDIDEIRRFTNIPILQDASHSIGSEYKGKKVGSIADITTFSFFPTKNITTGEGGAVVSSNETYLALARKFKMHGLVRESKNFKLKNVGDWHQEVQSFGFNYRLSDINCALGISQLEKIDIFKQRRKEIFDFYNKELANLEEVKTPQTTVGSSPMWHLYPIRVDKNDRRALFDFLRSQNIIVQVNYLPVYWHPVFEDLGYKKGLCPIAEDYYLSEISLPIHPLLSDLDLEYVCETIFKFYGSK
jgi:dTDP-4-amino-4,6-dideoxygalactose transaminase